MLTLYWTFGESLNHHLRDLTNRVLVATFTLHWSANRIVFLCVVHVPAMASDMAGPQNACTLMSIICVKLCWCTRFHSGTLRLYSSISTASSALLLGFMGSVPRVRRASSSPPAWVLGGAVSKAADIFQMNCRTNHGAGRKNRLSSTVNQN
jgi:hypothetical protein